MNAEDRERELDRWLDEALARYSDVEPRAGLEQRILANLEARRQASRPWWRWTWIPVAAAVLIAVGAFWITRHRVQSVIPPVQVKHEVPAGAPPSRAERARVGTDVGAPSLAKRSEAKGGNTAARVHPHHPAPQPVRLAAAKEDLPRREVFPSRDGVGPMFPSPAPLNTQEVALIHLVKRDPEEVRMIAQEQEADRQRLAKMFEESGVPRK